jgi:hypothetical protein
LFTRRQQPYARDDDRERVTGARQAAEALFISKRPLSESSIPEPELPADQSPRKPRILRALSTVPVSHEEGEQPVIPEQRMTPEIPSSQFGRIRAWVKYGMTAAKVAAVYGVAVGAIERILRQA